MTEDLIFPQTATFVTMDIQDFYPNTCVNLEGRNAIQTFEGQDVARIGGEVWIWCARNLVADFDQRAGLGGDIRSRAHADRSASAARMRCAA